MNFAYTQEIGTNSPKTIQVMAFKTDKIFKHLCLGELDYAN